MGGINLKHMKRDDYLKLAALAAVGATGAGAAGIGPLAGMFGGAGAAGAGAGAVAGDAFMPGVLMGGVPAGTVAGDAFMPAMLGAEGASGAGAGLPWMKMADSGLRGLSMAQKAGLLGQQEQPMQPVPQPQATPTQPQSSVAINFPDAMRQQPTQAKLGGLLGGVDPEEEKRRRMMQMYGMA